ncbi:MAG TPA: Asp-tRNA(Asn)/Glu-tRNA(Gln) amidotransferase subunit GatA [Actinomycetales bacterium]|nr:Asp-tRNA(Asn)/Glu-tRNA(Gln) amidotransferase subunit GatA [Actinomycetales bacterium]
MGDLTRLDAAALGELLSAGEVSAVEVVDAFLERTEQVDGAVHAYLKVDGEGARAAAAEVDRARAAGEELGPLAGVPIAVKDNMVTEGLETTAASKILEGWKPPYDATVVARLRAAGMPILGKTNLDEFAMGSSTEFSAFGPSHNPWDLDRIPGGSGGGSAAAVGSFQAPLALGSDTGGSIRQPAAVTGTVGIKPTYGGVSRYGIIALASSLDQVGPVARRVPDAALLHSVIAGHDPLDSTSLPDQPADFLAATRRESLKGLRVGVVKELDGEGYQDSVRSSFEASLDLLRELGAEIVEVSCPTFDYSLAAYYLILPAEASSNLARFDGMKYGLRVEPTEGPVTAERVMSATRGAGFGPEVKRRIILGTHALSAGYFDAYYGSAQKARTLIQRDFAAAFEAADVLVSPAVPTTAFRFGEKIDDPLAMYLNDIATTPANMAGVPAMSLPSGVADDGLPVGFQIIAPAREDQRMYEVAGPLERALEERWGGPLLEVHAAKLAAALESGPGQPGGDRGPAGATGQGVEGGAR